MHSYKLLSDSCKSSHWRCSVRKDVLRNFAKFTGKHLCQGLFLNKIAGFSLSFTVNFAKLLRAPLLQNTSVCLLLFMVSKYFLSPLLPDPKPE